MAIRVPNARKLSIQIADPQKQESKMVAWPAVLTHPEDPELEYVESLDDLAATLGVGAAVITTDHYIIDSDGRRYELANTGSRHVELIETGNTLTLEQVLELVKQHADHAEQCCIAKIWAPTIREAFALVRSVSE